MKIYFADSSYEVSSDFKKKYVSEIEKAFKKVSELLPFGSRHINFFVQAREFNLIQETQDNGHTHNSEFIEMAFNPKVTGEEEQIILKNLRATVFHEMNHASRFNIPIYHYTFLDNCVMEGLATVFERDYTGSDPPYGKYPKNVNEWIKEIIEKNDMFAWQQYSFDHPDGRRWIAYKAGTYVIDEAMKYSGNSVIELTQMECSEILKLARIDITNYKGLN